MRNQGRITEWNDERSFGFVTPGGGGERAFLHISAFAARNKRPVVGDSITYVVNPGPKGPVAAEVVMVQAARGRVGLHAVAKKPTGIAGLLRSALLILLIGLGAWRIYHRVTAGGSHQWTSTPPESPDTPLHLNTATRPTSSRTAAVPESDFRCEGKTGCGQMRSCAEANFYIRNCPNTEMDGDGDGIPCEEQWCGH